MHNSTTGDIEAAHSSTYYGTLEDAQSSPVDSFPPDEMGVVNSIENTGGGKDDSSSSSSSRSRSCSSGWWKTLSKKRVNWWVTRAIYASVAVTVLAVLAAVVVILIIGNGAPDNRPLFSFDDFIGRKLTPAQFTAQWTQVQQGNGVREDAFTYWKVGSKESSDQSETVVVTCDLVLRRVKDGTESVLLDDGKRSNLDIPCNTPYELSDTLIIFKPKAVSVFRHSSKAKYIMFNTVTGKHRFVSPRTTHDNNVMQKLMHWCPDKSKKLLAYVENNNLFLHSLDGDDLDRATDKEITTDGDDDTIFNGSTDWLYEEEIFGDAKAFVWSADCRYIAFLKLNASRVPFYEWPTFGTTDPRNPFPRTNRVRIPAVGNPIPVPSVHIYDVAKEHVLTVDLADKEEGNFYIYDLQWANLTTLAAVKVNRVQQQRDIVLASVSAVPDDAYDIPGTLLQRMTTKTWFEHQRSLRFLNTGQYFVDIVPNPDCNHHFNVALFDLTKSEQDKFAKWIAPGEYDVTQISGVYNERTDEIYFVSTERSSTDRHVFAVNIMSGIKRNLTDLEAQAYYSVSVSPSGSHAILHYEGPEIPKSTLIQCDKEDDNDGIVLEDNAFLTQEVEKYRMPRVELTTIKNREGVDLNAIIMYPPDFTTSLAYPVLMYQYSGPGSQQVSSSFRSMHHAFSTYVASQGFIVVIADGRGTGFRGEKFLTQTFLKLGKLETEDQIDVAKHMQTLPYVDSKRIALWGWSYGGYMALNALFSAENKGVFQLGMSVAPVTSWLYYDAGYTERYMLLPEQNEAQYFNTSIFAHLVDENRKCLPAPEGGWPDLLLVHGTGDDNVHMHNSYNLMTQLQNCGIQFSFMAYPDKDHSIQGSNTQSHLYKMLADKLFAMRR